MRGERDREGEEGGKEKVNVEARDVSLFRGEQVVVASLAASLARRRSDPRDEKPSTTRGDQKEAGQALLRPLAGGHTHTHSHSHAGTHIDCTHAPAVSLLLSFSCIPPLLLLLLLLSTQVFCPAFALAVWQFAPFSLARQHCSAARVREIEASVCVAQCADGVPAA